jgi:hypothetical protein
MDLTIERVCVYTRLKDLVNMQKGAIIMFMGEGVGVSRDNFSTNLARVKNIQQRLRRDHAARDKFLEQAARAEEAQRNSYTLDLRLARDQREWRQGEHTTTLEMTFIYLVGMLDTFFGQWGQEHNLWGDDKWPTALPERFAEVGLPLRSDTKLLLSEYRARRDALADRGGIAGQKYCKAVGDSCFLNQRLAVDETYLDAAVEFIDHLAAATAVAKYVGPYRHESKSWWPQLMAQVFAA